MANSPANLSILALLAGLALSASSPVGAAETPAQLPPRQQNVQIDAVSSEIDYRNNTALLREVSITQGDLKVSAKEAVAQGGVNFANNNWVFRGDVHITTANGSLLSDTANVIFVDNRIARAIITGSPASFEQQLENGTDVARGRAGTIEYDIAAGSVSLRQDAFITDGKRDIRGENLIYSIRDQRIVAKAEPLGKRVRITIDPKADSSATTTVDDKIEDEKSKLQKAKPVDRVP